MSGVVFFLASGLDASGGRGVMSGGNAERLGQSMAAPPMVISRAMGRSGIQVWSGPRHYFQGQALTDDG